MWGRGSGSDDLGKKVEFEQVEGEKLGQEGDNKDESHAVVVCNVPRFVPSFSLYSVLCRLKNKKRELLA